MSRKKLLHYAKHPAILKTSAKTAISVGTVLAFINYSCSIMAVNLNSAQVTKILITYCVPFLVATYAAAKHAQCSGELEEDSRGWRQDKCQDSANQKVSS